MDVIGLGKCIPNASPVNLQPHQAYLQHRASIVMTVAATMLMAWGWSQVVEDILDDDQDMEDMNLGKRAAKARDEQLLAEVESWPQPCCHATLLEPFEV